MEKAIIVDGLRFILDERTHYYLSNGPRHKRRIRLHRYLWEREHGKISKGYVIHHIDHNRLNNELSNLALLTVHEHRMIHSKELTADQRERLRKNMILKAMPAAIKWHKSAEGHQWHKRHAACLEKTRERHIGKCENCGREFDKIRRQRFCSNACKSAWRRKLGLDLIEKRCPVCGRGFKTSRFSPSGTCGRSCANRMRSRLKHEG